MLLQPRAVWPEPDQVILEMRMMWQASWVPACDAGILLWVESCSWGLLLIAESLVVHWLCFVARRHSDFHLR